MALGGQVDLGGQALAAAGAAAGDNLLAVAGGHARAKAVAALAHQTGRLESPLHFNGSKLVGTPVEPGANERAGIGEGAAGVNAKLPSGPTA